jgi:hypothetical protein
MRPGALLSAGHHGFIMLMSAMGVHQVIVCASFHDVRLVSSCAHRFMMCATSHTWECSWVCSPLVFPAPHPGNFHPPLTEMLHRIGHRL